MRQVMSVARCCCGVPSPDINIQYEGELFVPAYEKTPCIASPDYDPHPDNSAIRILGETSAKKYSFESGIGSIVGGIGAHPGETPNANSLPYIGSVTVARFKVVQFKDAVIDEVGDPELSVVGQATIRAVKLDRTLSYCSSVASDFYPTSVQFDVWGRTFFQAPPFGSNITDFRGCNWVDIMPIIIDIRNDPTYQSNYNSPVTWVVEPVATTWTVQGAAAAAGPPVNDTPDYCATKFSLVVTSDAPWIHFDFN